MRRTALGFVPMTIGWRLLGGVLLGIAWTVLTVFPVVRAVESDVPDSLLLGVMFLVAITPALLAGRRHALAAELAWDERSITHTLGGRVKTAIAWREATIRSGGIGVGHRVLQIGDLDGRCITLVYGDGIAPAWLEGRRVVTREEASELLALAARLGRPILGAPSPERSDVPFVLPALLLAMPLVLWVAFTSSAMAGAEAMLVVCGLLVLPPLARARRALARVRTSEMVALEADEHGLVRARRLDGGRVLVDLAPAHHPDALVASRRGFVGATLRERLERPSSPYRMGERVLEAVYIETQADRVLRFEGLRTSFVDLFAYGGLLAMATAAVLVA